MILPSSSSHRRIGLTISASSGAAREAARVIRRDDDADLGHTVVDHPGELVRAPRAITDVEVLAVLERLQQLHRLDAPRLIEDGGRDVLDVGVDGPAEDEQHGDRHEERQREREAVAPKLDELFGDDPFEPADHLRWGGATAESFE